MIPISETVGANRIVPATAIPYPTGNPKLGVKEEKEFRRKMISTALQALAADIDKQTIFELEY